MNPSKFGPDSPGRLVRVTAQWGADYSFLPNPLPPDWDFPQSLWPLLTEAVAEYYRLDGFCRTLPSPSLVINPLRSREAIASSEIEGTFSTPRELWLFELNPREGTSEDDPVAQHHEVWNYFRAMEHGERTDLPLCLSLVRDMHAILMRGVRGRNKRPGEFRSMLVGIGERGRFIPPPPQELDEMLAQLERYWQLDTPRYHPIVECFLVHYQFEAIHPFQDGNGRIGRLLLTLMLQKAGGFSQPWLHMSEYFEKYRETYYELLFSISSRATWGEWVQYCLEGVREQAILARERCESLVKLREDHLKRLQSIKGSNRLLRILERIFTNPMVEITELQELLGVTYPTARADVEKLVDLGILAELPDTRPKTYYGAELMAIAYRGLGE